MTARYTIEPTLEQSEALRSWLAEGGWIAPDELVQDMLKLQETCGACEILRLTADETSLLLCYLEFVSGRQAARNDAPHLEALVIQCANVLIDVYI